MVFHFLHSGPGLLLILGAQNCDFSSLAVVKKLANGKYTWSDDYRLLFSIKNQATGERLDQPGKVKKAKAEFVHKLSGLLSSIN